MDKTLVNAWVANEAWIMEGDMDDSETAQMHVSQATHPNVQDHLPHRKTPTRMENRPHIDPPNDKSMTNELEGKLDRARSEANPPCPRVVTVEEDLERGDPCEHSDTEDDEPPGLIEVPSIHGTDEDDNDENMWYWSGDEDGWKETEVWILDCGVEEDEGRQERLQSHGQSEIEEMEGERDDRDKTVRLEVSNRNRLCSPSGSIGAAKKRNGADRKVRKEHGEDKAGPWSRSAQKKRNRWWKIGFWGALGTLALAGACVAVKAFRK